MLTRHVEVLYELMEQHAKEEFNKFLENCNLVSKTTGFSGGQTAQIGNGFYNSQRWNEVVQRFLDEIGDTRPI